MEAADALGHELKKVLPYSPNKMPVFIDPDFAKLVVNRAGERQDAPWILVAFDQDLITVVVGEHP
jgi:hypothetical protein